MPCPMGLLKSKIKAVNPLEFTAAPQNLTIANLKYDPDEKWSNLYREREKNHLYKWVGVQSGGEMLTRFEADGEDAVKLFIQEKFPPMLYNEGVEPQLIKFNDFLKWKKTQATNLASKDEIVPGDMLDGTAQKYFQEHYAQWRLNKRGVEGETVIHLLLNRDDPEALELAKILLKEFPGLAQDIYLGDEMFGQSPLHLAIVHDDYEMVSLLMSIGVDVSPRATGRFFLPEDQKTVPPKKNTDYVGYAYYGEYPLAFAACFGNKDIYDLLLQNGADPNKQDSFGNTVLHMCVINNSIDIYTYAVRHWAKPANVNILNYAGYTPLTLASKLGRKDIFEEMLELMKVEFWRFSDMACSAYPLTALDTIKPDGSTNWDSALMTVINGNTPEHLDMVGSEVIQRLLADKWKAFASSKLIERLILLILQLVVMSVAVYTRPSNTDDLMNWSKGDMKTYFRIPAEILAVLGCVYFVVGQQGSEMRTQGVRGYFMNLRNAPAKGVFLMANIFVLLCVPCRFLSVVQISFWQREGSSGNIWTDAEKCLLCFALPGSWVFLLFFARGAKLTGPFIQMIYSMIVGDIFRFAIISAIFLVSFSQAFYFVGKDMQQKQLDGSCKIPMEERRISTFESFPETFVTLFRASMGGYDYEEFECAHYEVLTKVIFVLYMICMPIMMINMLIAMMGNTYTTVIAQAEKAWRQQWAQIVMVLERSVKKDKLSKYQLEYSIKLNSKDSGGEEVRGLMVIKQTKKTRARQRKQAVANWKRMGHKVINVVEHMGVVKARRRLHAHGNNIEPLVLNDKKRAHLDDVRSISRMTYLDGTLLDSTLLSVPNTGTTPVSPSSPVVMHHPPPAQSVEVNDRELEMILKQVGELSQPSSASEQEMAEKPRASGSARPRLAKAGRSITDSPLPQVPETSPRRVTPDTFKRKQSPTVKDTRF